MDGVKCIIMLSVVDVDVDKITIAEANLECN